MTYERLAPVLIAIGVAEALEEPLAIEQVAEDCGGSLLAVRTVCAYAHATGLAHMASGECCAPRLMEAGRQYLAAQGTTDAAVLAFLPLTVDDLHARAALLRAGRLLVDEFRHALLAGRAVEHAAALVPRAFEKAMTERIAVDLFAAAIALMARLEAEQPAACVAEELLALELIAYADSCVGVELECGRLTEEDAARARAHLPSVLGLFQDTDVAQMSAWKEPADAALARHDAATSKASVADQRIEAWFRPFAGAAPTGYLLPGPAA
jgi:hypothetical protein